MRSDRDDFRDVVLDQDGTNRESISEGFGGSDDIWLSVFGEGGVSPQLASTEQTTLASSANSDCED